MKDYPPSIFGKPKAGKTLIVGSHLYEGVADRRGLYRDAVGLDMVDGDGVDILHNLEHSPTIDRFSHVECFSVMEHSERPWLVANNIEESMVKGGTLWVSVPFIWRVHAYPSDYWRFTIEAVQSIFPRIKWKSLEYCSHGEIVKAPHKMNVEGVRYMGRTEVIGAGVRC